MRIRNGLGTYESLDINYLLNVEEMECWKDEKVKNVVFPCHTEDMNSEVYISYVDPININK